jgi:ribosome-binding protein aMBF1 (putative translation factor)
MLMLQFAREAKKWSKAELARRAQMAAADIGKIERGILKPYASQARKLAAALGLAISEAEQLIAEVDVKVVDGSTPIDLQERNAHDTKSLRRA